MTNRVNLSQNCVALVLAQNNAARSVSVWAWEQVRLEEDIEDVLWRVRDEVDNNLRLELMRGLSAIRRVHARRMRVER